MEEIWEKLKILHKSKDDLIMELGRKRYDIDLLGRELKEVTDKLDAVMAGIQATVEELEEKNGIPKGSDYTLDLDKQEIVYESVSDRSDS